MTRNPSVPRFKFGGIPREGPGAPGTGAEAAAAWRMGVWGLTLPRGGGPACRTGKDCAAADGPPRTGAGVLGGDAGSGPGDGCARLCCPRRLGDVSRLGVRSIVQVKSSPLMWRTYRSSYSAIVTNTWSKS